MTTFDQRAETALRIVRDHLADLVDPANEIADLIDGKLCDVADCPPESCLRTEREWERELADVKRVLTEVTALLQQRLVQIGQGRYGVELKEPTDG